MGVSKHPQTEFLKSNSIFNSCFFPDSLWFIVSYILPTLTPEQGFYNEDGSIEVFSVDSLVDYIKEDGSIQDREILEDLKSIGVDSSLLVELSESMFREYEHYLDPFEFTDTKTKKNKSLSIQNEREQNLSELLTKLKNERPDINFESLPFTRRDMLEQLEKKFPANFNGLSSYSFSRFFDAQKLCGLRKGKKIK